MPLDQALTCWGGNDDYTFSFTPEEKSSEESDAVCVIQNTPANNRKVKPKYVKTKAIYYCFKSFNRDATVTNYFFHLCK